MLLHFMPELIMCTIFSIIIYNIFQKPENLLTLLQFYFII